MFAVGRCVVVDLVVLAVAGATVIATPAPATRLSQTGQGAPPASTSGTAGAKSKPAAPTTLAARGKIVAFEVRTQVLTLGTTSGDERFTLEPSTRLRQASHAISQDDLAKLAGHPATVRYHRTSGQTQVLSVRIESTTAPPQTKLY